MKAEGWPSIGHAEEGQPYASMTGVLYINVI